MNQDTLPPESANNPPVDDRPPAVAWHQRIRVKLLAGLFALFVAMAGVNLWLIWMQGLPLLLRESEQLNQQIAENLVNSLNQQFKQAETLSRDLANIAEVVPYDTTDYQRIFPHLMNFPGLQDLIAGGGIWPEPHRFDPARERRSFFWGRDSSGKLQYFDDYNNPQGPGYHREEWYVPARLQPDDHSYWSRSYIDPYSLQPMVTCTTPFHLDGEFAGVSTIDLRLEGVNALLQEKFRNRPGYAFVVDRNNKFIAFPDLTMVRVDSDFILASQLALFKPVFHPIADKLALLNHRDESLANRDTDSVKALAKAISDASNQIDLQEARVIAHNMGRLDENTPQLLTQFSTADDLLLREPVNVVIYGMPHTFWKIVSVFPVSETTRPAAGISRTVTWGSLASISLWGIIFAIFLWKVLFRRLDTMTAQVMQAAQENREIPLDLKHTDELGVLAHWYNYRTRQLHTALHGAEQGTLRLSQENAEHQLTATLLKKSLAMQHAVLDSANLIIISMDHNGMILNCNAGTTKLLGYPEQELIGKTFPHQLIDRPQLQEHQNWLEQRYHVRPTGFDLFTTAHDNGNTEAGEWLLTRQNGSRCHVLLSITRVLNSSGQMEGWLAVGTDISDRKISEQKLHVAIEEAKRSDKAKTNFLANMSHELRTPLNAILGFTHRLQKKLEGAVESRHMDALNTIERSGNHLMALINDLLDISKIEAGRMDLQLTEFDLGQLIDEVHAETRPLLENKPIDYGYHLPKDPVLIQADRKMLRQIIYNLVSNAIKATDHGSIDITLSHAHADGRIHLVVRDTGKGISPDSSRKLFQKFASLDTYVDGKASTGLGLYLTLNLVKLHGGNLSLDSSPGNGARFTIELPLRQPAG